VRNDLPLKKIKYYEGSLAIIEIIEKYNSSLNTEVLGCGAFKREKVANITARHLALSSNCLMMLLNEIMPNVRDNFVLCEAAGYGANIRRKIESDFIELTEKFQLHLDRVF